MRWAGPTRPRPAAGHVLTERVEKALSIVEIYASGVRGLGQTPGPAVFPPCENAPGPCGAAVFVYEHELFGTDARLPRRPLGR